MCSSSSEPEPTKRRKVTTVTETTTKVTRIVEEVDEEQAPPAVPTEDWRRIPKRLDFDRDPLEVLAEFGPSPFEVDLESGRVRSTLTSTGRVTILAEPIIGGYRQASLSLQSKTRKNEFRQSRHPRPTHQLVCWLAHGARVVSNQTPDHINRIRSDNRAQNLRWASRHEQALNRAEQRVTKRIRYSSDLLEDGEQILGEYKGKPDDPRPSDALYVAITSYNRVISDRRMANGTVRRYIMQPRASVHGYITFYVDGRKRSLHDIVYAMFHPDEPRPEAIDHVDGNKTNNLPGNLQGVTKKINSQRAIYQQGRTSHTKTAPVACIAYNASTSTPLMAFFSMAHAAIWLNAQLQIQHAEVKVAPKSCVNSSIMLYERDKTQCLVAKRWFFRRLLDEHVTEDCTQVIIDGQVVPIWTPDGVFEKVK